MKTLITASFIVLLALCLPGCRATPTTTAARKPLPATQPEPALTAAERQGELDSFDKVWTTIRDRHFDPKYNGVDWEAARVELRPKVENARTASEAHAAIHNLLEKLHQTHFGIIPKAAYEKLAVGSKANGVSGIDLRVVDGHALVTSVEPDSGGAKAGVKPGWELIAVRDQQAAESIEKISQAFEESTLKEIMLSRTLVGQLRGDIGTSVPATFVDGAKRTVTVEVPMQEPTGTAAQFGKMPTVYVHYDSKILPGSDVGYIYISAFLAPDIVTKFRESIERFKDSTSGLVIDVRGNPGGIGAQAMGIGNLLVSQRDQKLGTMTMRTGSINFVLNPQSVTYTKPVAVLVDGCSGSTSEILAQGLRDLGRAQVFGTATAGAALPSTITDLPNGDGFQYAFANYTSYGGDVLEGRGVQPDQVVPLTRAGLLSGHDEPLDAALRWIASQNRK
ncbi:S41 family peptidase [soil metagenome]